MYFDLSPMEALRSRGLDVQVRLENGARMSDRIQTTMNHCEQLVYETYAALDAEQQRAISHINFVWSTTARRGMGGGGTMNVRCNNVGDNELVGVFVHELGHVIDTGVYTGHPSAGSSAYIDQRSPVYTDDPSVAFYGISWANARSRLRDGSSLDFVTGYAMTDPFEDFAESYSFYMLHGSQFRYMSQSNARLRAKYDYLQWRVFNGQEFYNGSWKAQARSRSYDSTVLPFPLDNFLKKS